MTRAENAIEHVLHRIPVGYRTNPFEAWVALFGIISGAFYLAGVAQSTALSETLPNWAQRVWGGTFVLACVLILRGLHAMVDNAGIVSILGRAVAAYKLGLRLVITVCLVYVPAVLYYAQTNAFAAAAPYVGLALAALLRLSVIRVSSARTSGWRR